MQIPRPSGYFRAAIAVFGEEERLRGVKLGDDPFLNVGGSVSVMETLVQAADFLHDDPRIVANTAEE